MMGSIVRRVLLLLLASLAYSGSPLFAQDEGWTAMEAGVEATRDELNALAARFEAGAASQAYSEELRAEARTEALAVRARLRDGDFRVGDRIVLTVEQQLPLSDTFIVAPGVILELPIVGDVSLDGVLRSELDVYLADRLSRFVNAPVVRTKSLIRLSVLGEVAAPGFYAFPAETPLAEVVMMVGGPSAEADFPKLRIEREGIVIMKGRDVELALQQGVTLAELGLKEGDQVVLPRNPRLSPAELVRGFLAFTGALVAVGALFGFR